jgi:type II secretion system protein N
MTTQSQPTNAEEKPTAAGVVSEQNEAPVAEFQETLRTGIHGLGPLKAPTSSWNDEEPQQTRRRRSYKMWLRYLTLGLVTFLFFIYVTFPYGVLKEVIVDRITQEMQRAGLPIRLSIGTLEPSWLTGIELTGVNVINVSHPSAQLSLGRARISLQPLSLVLGRISVRVFVEQAGGSLTLRTALPISTLMAGAPSPRSIDLKLRNFALDPLFNHALAFAAGSQDPGMLLVAPLLAKTSIGGKVSGTVSFDNPTPEHFGQAKGLFDVSVSEGFLHIDDETLRIRKQSFTTANLDLSFEGSALVLGKATKFAAEDIEIELDGRIALPDLSQQPTQVNINLLLTMRDKILDTLGFIVPNMLRCPAMNNGVLKVNLSGPASSMTCAAN